MSGIERCGAQRPFRLQAITHKAAHHIIQPAALQQVIGEDVVGAQRHCLRQMAQRIQRLHKFRQQMIVRAAQLDGQPRPKLRHQVFSRDQLVIGRNARRHEGIEIDALQAACMAADQLFRNKPGLYDAAHARITLDDAAHIHDFRNTADLRP
ncbi:hypothetical protein D3C72_1183590 [compost metagenome]